MRKVLITIGVLVMCAPIGALLFAWSGLYSVSASKGHLPTVAWFLHFAMRNSVDAHADGVKPPPLDDPRLVAMGAGHYEGGCAPCHGAPGRLQNPVQLQMLPSPPDLARRLPWKDEELFWIVKHGIKYTGMPGWAAQERDDEVWAVVAFLRQLPDLTPADYRRWAFGEVAPLAQGSPDRPRLLAIAGPLGDSIAACARCHGLDGEGRANGAFPRLSIQSASYIYQALRTYRISERPSGIMQPVAAELDDKEMRALAEYYAAASQSSNAASPQRGMPPDGTLRLGGIIAHQGFSAEGIVACQSCHGPDRIADVPVLSGQHRDYLHQQLRLFKAGVRGGSKAVIMTTIANRMSEQQMEAVANYYASLEPGSEKAQNTSIPGR